MPQYLAKSYSDEPGNTTGNTSNQVEMNTATEITLSSAASPIPFSKIEIPPCQHILYVDINDSGVRVWDLIILIPNSVFLLFLFFYLKPSIAKLRASSSPIFTAFYGLIFAVSSIGVLRCVVSMTVNATIPAGDVADKVLWLLLRFFLLATELSVVIFGLAFGHLDSKTSIRRVLIITFLIALFYSSVQGGLELAYDHPDFKGKSGAAADNSTYVSYDLFAHGGMIFLFTTSIFFFIIYSIIIILPFTKLRERFLLPSKKSFYYYCAILAVLNIAEAVSALLLYFNNSTSLCVIDCTTYLYFSFYNPLVYGVFLWNFFRSSAGSLSFSYKHQEDLLEDDQVSLPYSHGTTKHEDAPIFSYDSTHFDVSFSQSGGGSLGSFTNLGSAPRYAVNADLPSKDDEND